MEAISATKEAFTPVEHPPTQELLLTGDAGRISLDGLTRVVEAGGRLVNRGVQFSKDRLTEAYDRNLQWRGARAERTIDRMDRKDEFYSSLGAVALAVLDGQPEDSVTRVAPQTWLERRVDRVVDKRLDKLALKRVRRDNEGLKPSQAHGIRPMISQGARRSEAAGRYKRGEITLGELKAEKLRIKATRSTAPRVSGNKTVAVRGTQQRVASRRATREAFYTGMHAEQSVMPHWRELRRRQAERTARKAARRRTTP